MVSAQDGRRLRGERARTAILARAADIASVDGLEGLSIGRLAGECGTSKSNIAAHFGSKAQLQLAAVGYAGEVFTAEVVMPALDADEGLPRLLALYRQWMDYSRRRVFSGGCFFAAVTAEFDARDGEMREVLRERRTNWLGLQQRLIAQAQQAGQLAAELDASQLAFELDAYALAANTHAVLFDDETAYHRAWLAISERVERSRRR